MLRQKPSNPRRTRQLTAGDRINGCSGNLPAGFCSADEALDQFRESYTEEECAAEFDRLFPLGFSGSDMCKEIALDRFAHISGDNADETERNIGELVGRC